MRMLQEPVCAWICAAAGLLIHMAFLLRALQAEGAGRKRAALLALPLPAALALGFARGGYALLQAEESATSFAWCFTAGLCGLLLGTALVARPAKTGAWRLLDRTAPGACLATACARLGQRWLGETGFGPWLEEDSFWSGTFLALRTEYDEPVLGIFWAEAGTALLAAVFAFLWLRRYSGKRPAGNTAAVSAAILVIPQIVWEQLRTGQCMFWRMVRTEQVLCAALAWAAILFLCGARRETKAVSAARAWGPAAAFLAPAGLIVTVQFVLDGKWMTWPEPVCWTVYALSAAALAALAVISALPAGREKPRAARG